METDASFGTWIRKRRKALDLSRNALAQRVGCSLALVEKIETGARRPSRQIAALLASALEIPAEERATFLKVARGERAVVRLVEAWTTSPEPSATNLPIPYTSLVGRQTELDHIGELLENSECRLLTLVGPGGIGKTRLAIEAGGRARQVFRDGVYFAALAGLSGPEFIPSAVADALEVKLPSVGDPKPQLWEHLRGKHLLLIMDNFEHLLEGSNLLVEILLHAPAVKLITTSREPLDLLGEWQFEVKGLPLPEAVQGVEFEENSAVTLFRQRAMQARTDFVLRTEERAPLARICRMVDGLPLALELAAAWTRTLSCDVIAQEIERDMDFLSSSMRNLPERHRSLRAVFDHSWRLLSEEEQSVLMKLAVFRGGFTRELAEQVAGASLPTLSALITKSLVRPVGDKRYDLHEAIRKYALTQLNTAGQTEGTRSAHLRALLELAESAEPYLAEGDPGEWLSYVEVEHDNFRAALQWAFDAGEVDSGLRLSIALWRFWHLRSYLSEGSQWMERSLQAAGSRASAMLRGRALVRAGFLAYYQNRFDQAIDWLEESRALQAEMDGRDVANADLVSGMIAEERGEFARSARFFDEAAKRFRALNYEYGVFCAVNGQGTLAYARGDLDAAETLYAECLDLARKRGDKDNIATALCNQGWIAALRGSAESAMLCREALGIFRELGNKYAIANGLEGIAAGIALSGQSELAVRLFGAANGLRESIGALPNDTDARYLERMVQSARLALPAKTFASLWTEGKAMALEEAIAHALDEA